VKRGVALSEKHFNVAVAVDQGFGYFIRPLVIAGDESIDRPSPDSNQDSGLPRSGLHGIDVFPAQIRDEVSEVIDADDPPQKRFLLPHRAHQKAADRIVNHGAEQFLRHPRAQPGGGRCEYVAAVESRTSRLQPIVAIVDFSHLGPRMLIKDFAEQPVIRTDEKRDSRGDQQRPPACSDPGIDHRNVDGPFRKIANAGRQEKSGIFDPMRRNIMR